MKYDENLDILTTTTRYIILNVYMRNHFVCTFFNNINKKQTRVAENILNKIHMVFQKCEIYDGCLIILYMYFRNFPKLYA